MCIRDRLKGGLALSKKGISVMGIPGTIDNDLGYTDYTIGFDTACLLYTSQAIPNSTLWFRPSGLVISTQNSRFITKEQSDANLV